MDECAVPLWPDGAPGALGTADQDVPALTPYLCDGRSTRSAILICPGGGYGGLADYEGHDYALFLNRAGINSFVLKYRLGTDGYRHPAMLEDAARAVRLVRAHAGEWGVDPSRVGIMGSSAGGHLAATLLTHWDLGNSSAADSVERESSRPDFGVLCYAVISMGPHSHAGSRENLLGSSPSAGLVKELSCELQVKPNTPPCFVWHTFDDQLVEVDNALAFAAALRKNRVPFELHVYEKGDHGVALGTVPPEFAGAHPWTGELVRWLGERGFC